MYNVEKSDDVAHEQLKSTTRLPLQIKQGFLFRNCGVVSYLSLAWNFKQNKERWPQIQSKFTGKPPIIRYSTSTRKDTSELRITQESQAVGGEKGVYGLQGKITSIMSDDHRGQTGLMDLKTPPRPPLYCQRRQADNVMLVGEKNF
jgi:hypothetical protein